MHESDPEPNELMRDALIAQRNGNLALAESLYNKFLDIYGPRSEILSNLAGLKFIVGEILEASRLYKKAVDIGDNHPIILSGYGRTLMKTGNYSEASMAFKKALKFRPTDAKLWNDLGNAYFQANDLASAADAYQNAIHYDPQFARAFNNLGTTRRLQLDFKSALDAYDQACELLAETHTDMGEIRTNRAHTRLLIGHWTSGFKDYKWRYKKLGINSIPLPETCSWSGETLLGKTILIIAEQGYGDSI